MSHLTFVAKPAVVVVQAASVIAIGGLALCGCAWAGGAAVGAVLVLLLAVAAGCGAQVTVAGDDGNPDTPQDPPDDPPDNPPDNPPDDPPDDPPPDPEACGDGYCPEPMFCGSLDGDPWCFPDSDQDELVDDDDTCPHVVDPDQLDGDQDGLGDLCDLCVGPSDQDPCGASCCDDPDGDGVPGAEVTPGVSLAEDNCPYIANPGQEDGDQDGIGDHCDLCPEQFNPLSPCGDPCLDSDGDGVSDMGFCGQGDTDSCPFTASDHAGDLDGDGTGDVCDPDGIAPIEGQDTAALRCEPSEREQRRHAVLFRLQRSGVLDHETVGLALQTRGQPAG